jgi:ADP-heptose:LPS heptosyltransferase
MELFVPFEVQEIADQRLQNANIDPDTPFIAVSPGASCSARRYDPVRFARVIELLARETELPITVMGSQKDQETLTPVTEVTRKKGRIVSLMGKTTVPEFIGVIKRSSLVICNNSSSLHIADAFKRPLVVLYSGTEYIQQWEPRFAPSRLINRTTECSPCFRFQCQFQMECLDISPEEVVREACSLLEESFHPAKPASGFAS